MSDEAVCRTAPGLSKMQEMQNAALRISHWLSDLSNCHFQKYWESFSKKYCSDSSDSSEKNHFFFYFLSTFGKCNLTHLTTDVMFGAGGGELRMRTTNENERILASLYKNERTWICPFLPIFCPFLVKKWAKTGKKTGEQNRTLAKQGETKSFAEFWFGIATPWFGGQRFVVLAMFLFWKVALFLYGEVAWFFLWRGCVFLCMERLHDFFLCGEVVWFFVWWGCVIFLTHSLTHLIIMEIPTNRPKPRLLELLRAVKKFTHDSWQVTCDMWWGVNIRPVFNNTLCRFISAHSNQRQWWLPVVMNV